MCKKKTNKARRTNAQIKVCTDEIREVIRHADNLKFRGKIEVIKKELGLS